MVVPAYALCNLSPVQVGEHTPDELEFMIAVRKEQMKIMQAPGQAPAEPKKKKHFVPMDEEEFGKFADEHNRRVNKKHA